MMYEARDSCLVITALEHNSRYCIDASLVMQLEPASWPCLVALM